MRAHGIKIVAALIVAALSVGCLPGIVTASSTPSGTADSTENTIITHPAHITDYCIYVHMTDRAGQGLAGWTFTVYDHFVIGGREHRMELVSGTTDQDGNITFRLDPAVIRMAQHNLCDLTVELTGQPLGMVLTTPDQMLVSFDERGACYIGFQAKPLVYLPGTIDISCVDNETGAAEQDWTFEVFEVTVWGNCVIFTSLGTTTTDPTGHAAFNVTDVTSQYLVKMAGCPRLGATLVDTELSVDFDGGDLCQLQFRSVPLTAPAV